MSTLIESDVEAAIKLHEGNVTLAAETLGVRRDELWDFVLRWPTLLILLENLREMLVDAAEEVLRVALRAKKPWAVTFILRTVGKERGWSVGGSSPSGSEGEGGKPQDF